MSAFIHTTQSNVVESLDLNDDEPTQRGFLDRLQGDLSERGVVHVLLRGNWQ